MKRPIQLLTTFAVKLTGDDECIDSENCSNQLVNETSSDDESMNDDSGDDQTMDASSSDDQSVDDAISDDHVKDKAMSSDENSEEVSCVRNSLVFLSYFQDDMMVTDDDADEHAIKIPIEVAISSKR